MRVAGAVWNSGASPELLEKLGKRALESLSDPVTAHPEVKPTRCGKFARNRPSRKDNKKFALYWARIAYPLYSEEQAHGVTFKTKRTSLPRYCPSRVV